MRLIDADAFKEYMRKALEETRGYYPDNGEWAEAITEQFCEDIDDQPTIEPQRKTGKWIKVNGKTAINCSICYHCSWSLSFEYTVKRFNFCPNCGADMRGKQDE